MTSKKVIEQYKNPEMDIDKRPFITNKDKKYKQMMELAIKEINEDKNSEFKFCLDHLFISGTRAGSKLHKEFGSVYTAK